MAQDVQLSVNHDFDLVVHLLPLLVLDEGLLPGLYRVDLDQVETWLMDGDEVGAMTLSDFDEFGYKVDDFLVDDGKLMFLLETMPPGQLDPKTDLFVDLCLAAEDPLGAFHALLDIFPNLIQRLRQRLTVLPDQGQHIPYIHLVEQFLLKGFDVLGEHIKAKGLELVVFIVVALMNCLFVVGLVEVRPGVANL